ncbi:MAG TPA: MBL fold metallo-hydrolase [Candidatus Sulfotelmatobacter sp.]|nr:MBL fold metallo-hydrolase [Candidatus Sulfotelmatobacter sp.]HUI75527.1 MBL fold metallo-hydrolase [Candidatus Acidoferrum sp.]
MRKLLINLLITSMVAQALYGQITAPDGNQLPFTLKPLGHGVYAAIDDAKGDAGANAGFVIGDDGVAVIDTFEHEAAAKALFSEIRKLSPLPIKYVINTHYHLDHVAGNKLFEDAGAVILAQANVHSWIHTENLKFFGKNITPAQKAEVENLAAPEIVYNTGIDLYLGKRRLIVRVLPGHTGGDSIVRIPDADITFCGDLFWRKTLPNLIDATTSRWMGSLKTIQEYGVSGTYVPGHGDVGTMADVAAFQAYLSDLREWTASAIKDGKTGDALLSAVMPYLQGKYGTWNFFSYFAKRNVQDMAAEIRGDKRVPKPVSQ